MLEYLERKHLYSISFLNGGGAPDVLCAHSLSLFFFFVHLISLCFIVGRSHKKYTVIKKENKKAVYGKPGGAFLSHISTCRMLFSLHFKFFQMVMK